MVNQIMTPDEAAQLDSYRLHLIQDGQHLTLVPFALAPGGGIVYKFHPSSQFRQLSEILQEKGYHDPQEKFPDIRMLGLPKRGVRTTFYVVTSKRSGAHFIPYRLNASIIRMEPLPTPELTSV